MNGIGQPAAKAGGGEVIKTRAQVAFVPGFSVTNDHIGNEERLPLSNRLGFGLGVVKSPKAGNLGQGNMPGDLAGGFELGGRGAIEEKFTSTRGRILVVNPWLVGLGIRLGREVRAMALKNGTTVRCPD